MSTKEMDVRNFNRFKRIIEIIQEFNKKRDKVDKFFEAEIMENSFCMVTYGEPILLTLTNMLADEYDCWYSTTNSNPSFWWKSDKQYDLSNEIEWWLYEADEGNKIIVVDGIKYNVTSIESFYDYLMEMYYQKELSGSHVKYSDKKMKEISSEDSIEILKSLYQSEI